MKKLVVAVVGVMLARLAVADYTPVEWIQATGNQWINTKYTPACTDKIEMKVNFTTKDTTQALWCSRGKTTTENTFTSFLVSGKVRIDRKNAAGSSLDLAVAAGTDYVITADYNACTASITDGTTTKTLSNMTSGDFTPGSPLTLFASHQDGTGLTAESGSLGNKGTYKLYSVKLTDKDGNLVRNFVPVKNTAVTTGVNSVGLFDTVTRTFVGNTGAGVFTVGEATGAADYPVVAAESRYEKNVAAGSRVTLTAAEVAEAAGKIFVKTGAGTLVVGDEMADFAGDIHISEGFYEITTRGALGTAAGKTTVDGGTLVSAMTMTVSGGTGCLFPNEEIHLLGTGCQGKGALYAKAQCNDFARTVVLDGETTITTDKRFDFRSTAFNMNGYKLTVTGNTVNNATGEFYLVNEVFSRMGDIECTKGLLEFQASINNPITAATVTMRKGTTLSFWDVKSWLSCKFVLESGVNLKTTNGAFKYEGTDNRNIFSANSILELQGIVGNNLNKKTQFQFRGKITGDGGIKGGQGGYLQLIYNGENDFKGGLDITGVVENGFPVGGIVAYFDKNIPYGEGAAPLKLTNALLEQRNQATFHLPDVEANNRVVISNMASVTSCMAKSLVKTCAEELTVFGPLSVEGSTAIDAGTLKMVGKVPDYVPGLKWTYKNTQAGINANTDQGVDTTGVGYAYKGWPEGVDIDLTYSGYILVPGEPGTEVTCNWISSIARACSVKVGDVTCASANDQTNNKDGWKSTDYNRLFVYKPVTLKAGWQPITVHMWNWYNDQRGPQTNDKIGWVANFGIGVDWQNRGETNSTHYAKLLDPGDGSFLRATLDPAARTTLMTDAKYRPTFGGAVAFGPGAALDIGDTAPYWPVKMPSLTGCPTVRNGAVAVESATWTIRKSDVLDAAGLAVNKPLTLDNATLSFPSATVTVDVSADDAAALKAFGKTRECALIADTTAFAGTTFTASETLRGTGWKLVSEKGALKLCHSTGLLIILR